MISDQQLLALTLVIWLRIAGSSIPPLLREWSGYGLQFLDELHGVSPQQFPCFNKIENACFKNLYLFMILYFLPPFQTYSAVRCNCMSNYACLEVLSSPSTDDAGLQMTQSILYGSSGVSWQSLDHGFHVLMDAWKRHQRRFPSPGAVLAAAMKVLCHRLFLRYADGVGWKQEHYRQFFNPFWLEPTAFNAAETVHQPVPQVSLVYRLRIF